MKKLLKKGIAALLLLTLVLSLLSGVALADYVVSNTGKSYIRTEPNTAASSVGTIAEGEQLEYLGSTRTDYRGIDWYYVRKGSTTGWVSSRYTDLIITNTHSYDYGDSSASDYYIDANGNAIFSGMPTGNERIAYPAPEPEEYDHYVIASGGHTYIRSAPSVNSSELGLLPEGAYAPYLEEYSIASNGRYWYKVKYSGITGWVSAKYTELQ